VWNRCASQHGVWNSSSHLVSFSPFASIYALIGSTALPVGVSAGDEVPTNSFQRPRCTIARLIT
jgi:hypothetical protein